MMILPLFSLPCLFKSKIVWLDPAPLITRFFATLMSILLRLGNVPAPTLIVSPDSA